MQEHCGLRKNSDPYDVCCSFLGDAPDEEKAILQEIVNTVYHGRRDKMKPLKLTMQAFGSYVAPGTIDFERTERNLFLITGDTGAGKTNRSLMPLYLHYMGKRVPE